MLDQQSSHFEVLKRELLDAKQTSSHPLLQIQLNEQATEVTVSNFDREAAKMGETPWKLLYNN